MQQRRDTPRKADHYVQVLRLLWNYGRDKLDWPLELCCTNGMRDSSRESSVVAGMHEQTYTPDLQDQELASL
jgi:hypothetical protein